MKFLNNYAVIDLETSGLNLDQGAQIISVSALRIIGNLIEDQFFSLLNSDKNIHPLVEDITGIAPQILKNAPPRLTVFPQFLSFIGDLPLVVHNAAFIKKFLEDEIHKQNLHVSLQYNDTFLMAKQMYPGPNCSIDGLLKKFDIQHQLIDGYYFSDIKNIYQIYEVIKKQNYL